MKSSSLVGKVIGNYRVIRKIGEGGMGAVYLSRDLRLEREVALKIVAPELARNAGLMARFRVEAIAQAKLNHTNIVTIYSFEQEKEMYYIVMEYVEGSTLRTMIKENGPMPLERALDIILHVLDGLNYAHSRGVVHRDIKPSNIFLSHDGVAKIGDFGIAKVEGIELTKTGTSLGSPVYSSPEQLMGKKTDARTDIYSSGMTLYEMITGAPAIKVTGKGDYKAIMETLDAVPGQPSTVNPSIPPVVDELVMKSIAKDPVQRFKDADSFRLAIKQVIAVLPEAMLNLEQQKKSGSEARKSGTPPREKKRKLGKENKVQPNRKLLLIAGVMAILLVTILLVMILSDKEKPAPLMISTSSSLPVTPSQGTNDINTGPGRGGTQQPSSQPRPQPGTSSVSTPSSPTSSGTGEPAPDTPNPQTPSSLRSPISTRMNPTELANGTEEPAKDRDVVKKIDKLIEGKEYSKAISSGQKAIKEGIVSADIYLVLARAYYYDGKKKEARFCLMKSLELKSPLGIDTEYQYEKGRLLPGTLQISRKKVMFQLKSKKYGFSLDISQVNKIYEDAMADFTGLFRKKKNRRPILIIKDWNRNRYVIRFQPQELKLRGFVKFMINELKGKK